MIPPDLSILTADEFEEEIESRRERLQQLLVESEPATNLSQISELRSEIEELETIFDESLTHFRANEPHPREQVEEFNSDLESHSVHETRSIDNAEDADDESDSGGEGDKMWPTYVPNNDRTNVPAYSSGRPTFGASGFPPGQRAEPMRSSYQAHPPPNSGTPASPAHSSGIVPSFSTLPSQVDGGFDQEQPLLQSQVHYTPSRSTFPLKNSASSHSSQPIPLSSSSSKTIQSQSRKRFYSSPTAHHSEHRSKHLRRSPTPSLRPDVPLSPSSSDSIPDDISESVLELLGGGEEARAQILEMRRMEREHEKKRERERLDEEYARQLQAEIDGIIDTSQSSQHQSTSFNADAPRFQSYLNSDGGLRRFESSLSGNPVSSAVPQLPSSLSAQQNIPRQDIPQPSFPQQTSPRFVNGNQPENVFSSRPAGSNTYPSQNGNSNSWRQTPVPVYNLDSDDSESPISVAPLQQNYSTPSRSTQNELRHSGLPGAWPDTSSNPALTSSPIVQRSRPIPDFLPQYQPSYRLSGTDVYRDNRASGTTMFGRFYDGLSNIASRFGGSLEPDWNNPIDVDALPDLSPTNNPASHIFPESSYIRSISGPWFGNGSTYPDSRDDYQNPNETAKEIQELVKNIRPDEELGLSDRTGSPEDMAPGCGLYEHQKLGLAWMAKMEEGSNKGGILADDMGLGKTIQAIALMVSRRSENSKTKTNLIVCPVALLKQWESEIQIKVKAAKRLSTYIYHGAKKNVKFNVLKRYDVVLTTYGTITAEYNRKMALEKRVAENRDLQVRDDGPNLPLLGCDSKFYRIILDEAQNIKNKNTKAYHAVCCLQAISRFCMTGTPMMNNLNELYSLISFLRIKPYCESRKFQSEIIAPLKEHSSTSSSRAMRKLHALLKAILLRRTKDSKINGNPILTLPTRTTTVEHAIMEGDQLQFYDALQKQTQIRFNRYLREGTVNRNYHGVLLLLLRLRQTCCHPHLIRNLAEEVAGTTDKSPEQLESIAREYLGPEAVKRLIEEGQVDCPICMDAVENSTVFTPCGHATCPECFSKISDPAQSMDDDLDSRSNKFKCMSCRGLVDPTKVTDWKSFERVFMSQETKGDESSEENSPQSGSEGLDDDTEPEESEDETDSLDGFIVNDEEPKSKASKIKRRPSDGIATSELDNIFDFDAASGSVATTATMKNEDSMITTSNGEGFSKKSEAKKEKKRKDWHRKKKGRGKKKEKLNIKLKNPTLAELQREARKNMEARRMYFAKLEEEYVTSAKIDKCLGILDRIAARGKGEKTIIFSQFTTFLDLVEVPLSQRNVFYKRYDGSMSATARNDAVLEFTLRPNCLIMLVSLKAGNAGLNLTAANNVIILDPFWNPYIEKQAVDRVHRIGQRREVNCYRILIKDTVEDRIMEIQERKRALIEGALDENASQGIARLTARDLAYIFGISTDDS